MTHLDRRQLLFTASAFAGMSVLAPMAFAAPAGEAAWTNSPFRKISDADWKKKLGGGLSYAVMRHEDTEQPGSSPLLNEHRTGTFNCRGCDLPLFESKWKFESGTGWPSFYDVIKENIGTKVDHLLITETRTEYHCARCLGHQGHVFNDGPKPTGLRYCNNGVALTFKPTKA